MKAPLQKEKQKTKGKKINKTQSKEKSSKISLHDNYNT